MRGALWSVGAFSFFINLLMLTGPIYMLQVYDRVLSSQSKSTLVSLSVLMGILYVFVWLLDRTRSKVLIRFGNSVECQLAESTFESGMRLSLGENRKDSGIPIKDLGTLRKFFSSNAMATIFDLPWVPVYLGVIFLLHWTLGVFALCGAIVIVGCAIYIKFAAKSSQIEERKCQLQTQAIEDQTYRNAGLVKALGMEKNLFLRWNSLNNQAITHSTHGDDRVSGVRSFSKAFRLFLQSGILGIGAALAIAQIVTPGTMIAGSIILGRALSPAQSLISQWSLIAAAREAYKRLNAIHSTLEGMVEHMNLPTPQGHIDVRGLIAGPPNSKKPVVMGLNFSLTPGDGLAIVGPSASGKSTLAKLLVGNWLPQKGEVRLDGATFQQWQANQSSGGAGQFMGYLPQNIEMFDGTIKDNIARFDPRANETQVIEAAHRAGVHELILSMPQGYATMLGREGLPLSGGQMQRIALARALYGDPSFIVLDEPNANLDESGEKALTSAILDVRGRGKTVVVITHRTNGLTGLNKILVLKNGRQVKFGPTELILSQLRETAKSVSPKQTSTVGGQTPHQTVAQQSPHLGVNPYADQSNLQQSQYRHVPQAVNGGR